MEKTTKILVVTAIITILVVAAAAVIYSQIPKNANPLPSGEPLAWQIKVSGEVAEEKTFTLKELSQMPLTNVTTMVNAENVTYWGVSLYDFCNKTSMLWDAGPINIISSQDNKATLNIYQAYNSSNTNHHNYNRNVIMLAFIKDGKWLTNETGGPVRLVAPYFASEYQVQSVAEVHMDLWTVSISGEVTNPLVITGENLTSFQPRTVYAEFASSEKRWSNWTGLPILDVLQAANMSEQAEKITVIAIDGKVSNFTLQQVQEGEMLIGYEENGNNLQHGQGGPFRLFAPTDQYKWALYWVKFVHEIIVS